MQHTALFQMQFITTAIREGKYLKKRPCIGIVARSIDESYATEVIEGAVKQAFEMNYDVAVFSMFDENSYICLLYTSPSPRD